MRPMRYVHRDEHPTDEKIEKKRVKCYWIEKNRRQIKVWKSRVKSWVPKNWRPNTGDQTQSETTQSKFTVPIVWTFKTMLCYGCSVCKVFWCVHVQGKHCCPCWSVGSARAPLWTDWTDTIYIHLPTANTCIFFGQSMFSVLLQVKHVRDWDLVSLARPEGCEIQCRANFGSELDRPTLLGATLWTPGSIWKRNAREALFNTNSRRRLSQSWHPAHLINRVGCMFISNFPPGPWVIRLSSACTKTSLQSSTSIHSNNKEPTSSSCVALQ